MKVQTSMVPIENIRQHQMRALLDDLHARERRGLEDEQCDLIKAALAKLSNAAAEIPDGSFYSRTVLAETERMADIYDKWNGIAGEDAAAARKRKAALRKLRSQRQRLAKRVHLNQFVLQNELDKKLIADMYTAFGNIPKAAPQIFVNLAESIAKSSADFD